MRPGCALWCSFLSFTVRVCECDGPPGRRETLHYNLAQLLCSAYEFMGMGFSYGNQGVELKRWASISSVR